MQNANRLYLILHPTAALIGSQLPPEELARHYTVGPTRYYRGKVLFVELDPAFRHPYFAIEAGLADLRPHEDGRPKATKYISTYRVLEHVDFAALRGLYLTSAEGYCLPLKQGPYEPALAGNDLRIFAEITPLRMLVLSKMDFLGFGQFITDAANPIGAPRFFYTQVELDSDGFLAEYEANPFMQPPLRNLHPEILASAIRELGAARSKSNKGLSLHSNLDSLSYRLITRGFMFAGRGESRFYPMPQAADIEKANLKFYRSI
jgi:hypothetical protein